MPVASMTGFARAEDQTADARWTWELRSVNGRNLDLRFRLPPRSEGVEAHAREALGRRFRRGSISINLQVDRSSQALEVTINRPLLDRFLELADGLHAEGKVERPRLDGLLALRGVVETGEVEEGEDVLREREAAVLRSLDVALEALEAARRQEGARLVEILTSQINEVADLTASARKCAAVHPAALRQRLESQLAILAAAAPSLPEERVAQEVALLLVKADVSEELDRLDAHVGQARELLAQAEPIGRKLDFLSQEFNREANTLCAKAADNELTRIGLELKAVIDRFREQVQNVE